LAAEESIAMKRMEID